jgi:hypothetical protein
MAMDFKAVADLEDPVTACKVIIAGLAPLSDLNLVTYGAHPTGMVASVCEILLTPLDSCHAPSGQGMHPACTVRC